MAVPVVSAALPLLLLAQLAPAFQLTYEPAQDSPALLQLTQSRAPSPEALQIDCTRARQGRCSQRATVGPGPPFIQAGATRAEADAMALPALRYSPGERWRYRFSLWLPETAASPPPLAILWQWKRFNGRPPVLRHYSGPTTRDSRPRAAYVKWGLYQPGTIDGATAIPVRSVWHDAIDIRRLP